VLHKDNNSVIYLVKPPESPVLCWTP